MVVKLHQLFHGYQRGHELLAGSVTLPNTDAELVTRLSDLSGSLQDENEFKPYLTVYPLPSGRYYVFARTWPDLQAARAGCVLTHSVLIPSEKWGALDPSAVLQLHRNDSRDDIGQYRNPLETGPKIQLASQTDDDSYPSDVSRLFVTKYFGEGIRPIVWFEQSDAEQLLVCILRQLWPRLKARFSACTYSLQVRSLGGAPFDLLFAPASAYSRFSRLPRENLISATDAAQRTTKWSEPWCDDFARTIFSRNSPTSPPSHTSELWPLLDNDPTSIRKLYLLRELRERVPSSSTAALGTLDLVEALAPEAEDQRQLKVATVAQALEGIASLQSSAESIENVQRVCDRLLRPAFQDIASNPKVSAGVVAAIALRAVDDVPAALRGFEALLERSGGTGDLFASYQKGLAQALDEVATHSPNQFRSFEHYKTAAQELIRAKPAFAAQYLAAAKDNAASSRNVLMWLAGAGSDLDWNVAAEALVPQLGNAGSLSLAKLVFDHLQPDNVSWALDVLSENGALNHRWLIQSLERSLAQSHAGLVRRWAFSRHNWTRAVASLVSATFNADEAGLSEIISQQPIAAGNLTKLLVAYIERIAEHGIPPWMRRVFENEPLAISALLVGAEDADQWVLQCISDVAKQLDYVPAQAIFQDGKSLLRTAGRIVANDLLDLTMRSAVLGCIRGQFTPADCAKVLTGITVDDSGYRFSLHFLTNLIGREIQSDSSSWLRAWKWLSNHEIARYLSGISAICGVIEFLVEHAPRQWPDDVDSMWADALLAVCDGSAGDTCLRASVQALRVAFRNPLLPLGRTVAAAFPPVYVVVSQPVDASRITEELVSRWDWDRGKEMRRMLINAFTRSRWAPQHLAFAAARTFGIRKLFKRVSRKWDGEQYIGRMISDLSSNHTVHAKHLREELLALAADPNFYEEWD